MEIKKYQMQLFNSNIFLELKLTLWYKALLFISCQSNIAEEKIVEEFDEAIDYKLTINDKTAKLNMPTHAIQTIVLN